MLLNNQLIIKIQHTSPIPGEINSGIYIVSNCNLFKNLLNIYICVYWIILVVLLVVLRYEKVVPKFKIID